MLQSFFGEYFEVVVGEREEPIVVRAAPTGGTELIGTSVP